MKSFDDALNEHKRLLTESLINFDEGQRVRKIMLDIDSNSADYEYYFQAGQQSKQAEVDKLEKDNDGYRKLVNYDTQEMEKLHNKIDELKKLINDIELHTKVMIECLLSCSSPSIHMGGQLEAFMSISKILKGDQS